MVLAAVSVVYLLATLFVTNSYYQLIMTLVLVWATMGLSWNILSGYSGLISFGHAAFFGLGGYTMTIAFVKWGLTPWLGIPLGMVVGVIAAIMIGIPTFRLRGHYFALSMLAYPLALLYVFEWLGYQEETLPMMREAPALYMQFGDQRVYTALALVMLVAAMVISLHVERSRFGRSLLAYVFDAAFKLDAEGWRKLTLRWGLFFLFLAVVNEVVWRNFSEATWVAFKVWGIMPITVAFTILQMPLIMRHSVEEK